MTSAHKPISYSAIRGLTALDLVITLALVAIVIATAVPALKEFSLNQRMKSLYGITKYLILILLGFTLAAGVGAGAFELVGLKPDLGALVAGLMLARHPRAAELAERFKAKRLLVTDRDTAKGTSAGAPGLAGEPVAQPGMRRASVNRFGWGVSMASATAPSTG
mgnify:CR=1 FL=1